MVSERTRARVWGGVFLGALWTIGCSVEAPPAGMPAASGVSGSTSSSGGAISVGGTFGTGGASGSGGIIVGGAGGSAGGITDTRPVVSAERPPPPISGGTLLALAEQGRAVVADPDRDRIVVVDTETLVVLHEIALETGDEPGRLVEDGAGRVHVVLRGSGELVTVDPATGELVERRAVCQAPRGIAFDGANDALVVACVEGQLVELPATGGEPFRTTLVAPDLRDVVFLETTLVVTRFRSVELLYLDDARNVTARVTPLTGDPSFAATTAWRAIQGLDGGLIIAHQRALDTSIDTGADVGADLIPDCGTCRGSGYGSRFDPCASIVMGTLSTATPQGIVQTHKTTSRVALPVDVAVSPTGLIAIANAAFDPTSVIRGNSTSVEITPPPFQDHAGDCGSGTFTSNINATVTSITYDATGRLLALQREPSVLWVYNDDTTNALPISLGGANVTDIGHTLFHADSTTGIACASCHAEGGDDGHVWNFLGIGQRRTQPLDVGLEGTAPFHWDGGLATFGDLVHDVLERRMGGPLESPEHIAALERTVYGFRRRPPVRAADDESALRGKALFESVEVGCSECHAGPALTNSKTVNIGRSVDTQVPSLIGIASRPPYMHDGCAPTLAARFEPACGGTDHGDVTLLDEAQKSDLISYLETL
jgi:hypothetical protein